MLFTVTWKNQFGNKIELTLEHFRSHLFYNFRRGLSRRECIDVSKSLFGDKSPSCSTVKNCFNEFNCGRRLLKDKVREGRPKTAAEQRFLPPENTLTSESASKYWSETLGYSILFFYSSISLRPVGIENRLYRSTGYGTSYINHIYQDLEHLESPIRTKFGT